MKNGERKYMTKAVIFDMDGTVLDSMGQSLANRVGYLKILGVELSREEADELNHIGWHETASWINDLKGTKFEDKAFLDGILETHYNGYKESYKLIPGFIEFLDYLDSRGIKYAIATATRLYGAEYVFERFGLMDRIEFIITEGRVGVTKDHPDIYLEAARRMGADVSNTIVFEDALYAVKTAKNAGFKTIAIKENRFIDDAKEIAAISDHFVEDFVELLEKIEKKEIVI